MDAAKRQRLLDQIQTVRTELTKVAPGYDGPAGVMFGEIDVLESMIDDRDWTPAQRANTDWTAQC